MHLSRRLSMEKGESLVGQSESDAIIGDMNEVVRIKPVLKFRHRTSGRTVHASIFMSTYNRIKILDKRPRKRMQGNKVSKIFP